MKVYVSKCAVFWAKIDEAVSSLTYHKKILKQPFYKTLRFKEMGRHLIKNHRNSADKNMPDQEKLAVAIIWCEGAGSIEAVTMRGLFGKELYRRNMDLGFSTAKAAFVIRRPKKKK